MNKQKLEKENEAMFVTIAFLVVIIIVGMYAHWYYYEYEEPSHGNILCAIEVESCYTNFSISKEICEPLGVYATFTEYDKIMISDKQLQYTLNKINKRVNSVFVENSEVEQ